MPGRPFWTYGTITKRRLEHPRQRINGSPHRHSIAARAIGDDLRLRRSTIIPRSPPGIKCFVHNTPVQKLQNDGTIGVPNLGATLET